MLDSLIEFISDYICRRNKEYRGKHHLLGVSIAYLNSSIFRQELHDACIDYDSAKIFHMEPDLRSKENYGLIRQKGQNVVCPRDGELGAAYVDSIGSEHVGPANIMLSYSWRYHIKDVVDSLVAKCEQDGRDPKSTFVWMCCFCNNQHRISKTANVSFEEFQKTFHNTVSEIKIVWSMMAPWNKPEYLQRVW